MDDLAGVDFFQDPSQLKCDIQKFPRLHTPGNFQLIDWLSA